MSIVTSVIVTCPLGNERAIKTVNDWLDFERLWALKPAEAGGNKALQAKVFTGAFAGFNLPAFLERVRAAPWGRSKYHDDLANVRVFIQEEDDETFTERLHAAPAPPVFDQSWVAERAIRLASWRDGGDYAPLSPADVIRSIMQELGIAVP